MSARFKGFSVQGYGLESTSDISIHSMYFAPISHAHFIHTSMQTQIRVSLSASMNIPDLNDWDFRKKGGSHLGTHNLITLSVPSFFFAPHLFFFNSYLFYLGYYSHWCSGLTLVSVLQDPLLAVSWGIENLQEIKSKLTKCKASGLLLYWRLQILFLSQCFIFLHALGS